MTVDTQQNLLSTQNMNALIEALKLSSAPLNDVQGILLPLLPTINETERAAQPRPFSGFPAAALLLIQAVESRPQIMTLTGFNGDQLRSQLQAATELSAYLARLEELQQQLQDTRLLLLADAWSAALEVYRTAKGLEHLDPTLRAVIHPIADIFKGGKANPKTK